MEETAAAFDKHHRSGAFNKVNITPSLTWPKY